MRLRRNILSATGRDVTVENANGVFLFASSGDLFTLNKHTHVYHAHNGTRLAVVSKLNFAVHKTYEIAAYTPVCANQTSVEQDDGGIPLYNFARMTKSLVALYADWTIQVYNCDGTMQDLWEVQSKYWVSYKYHYDVVEKVRGSGIVGTIDQTYYFSATAYYDVWVTVGEDQALIATVAMILDQEHLSAEQQAAANSSAAGTVAGMKSTGTLASTPSIMFFILSVVFAMR